MLLPPPVLLLLLLHLCSAPLPSSAVNFLFNSFNASHDLTLIGDARVEQSAAVIRLNNDSNQFSYGRVFYPSPLPMIRTTTSAAGNASLISSFSTSFVFSILPLIPTSPGFGLAFVLTNSTSPAGALASQYFGIFTNATVPTVAPLIAVEFDTGQNPEFNDLDGNHIGIDLNNIESAATQTAGYYSSGNATSAGGDFVPIDMRNGQNIQAWIDFNGSQFQINVTIAPIGIPRPLRPLLSYTNPEIENYISGDMFVGISASTVTWVEEQRILAWSLSDTGRPARDINTSNLPVFLPESSSSSSLAAGAIAGISIAAVLFIFCVSGSLWFWRWRKRKIQQEKEDRIEEWELEYWPHRFSYEELSKCTNGFSQENLLGFGGFGKVYKGVLPNSTEIAVKCVNHDSNQGLREFMAEISSIGRLQHKNLVQMRGWCRKRNELMLIYDYMSNGSLNMWVFDNSKGVMGWNQRRRVLGDIAEGLCYLHHGWDHVVVHRDIKSGNVLLDSDMRGKLGDFGLAKLYEQGEAPSTTRLVGTLGYLAPELASKGAPTAASDVYGFGVVVLEVVCGRRPVETWREEEEEQVLVEWVRELYTIGQLREAADERVAGESGGEEVEAMLKLGLACCHPDPLHRPSMKEVVAVLLGEEAAAAPPDAAAQPTPLAGGSRSGSVAGGDGETPPNSLV